MQGECYSSMGRSEEPETYQQNYSRSHRKRKWLFDLNKLKKCWASAMDSIRNNIEIHSDRWSISKLFWTRTAMRRWAFVGGTATTSIWRTMVQITNTLEDIKFVPRDLRTSWRQLEYLCIRLMRVFLSIIITKAYTETCHTHWHETGFFHEHPSGGNYGRNWTAVFIWWFI